MRGPLRAELEIETAPLAGRVSFFAISVASDNRRKRGDFSGLLSTVAGVVGVFGPVDLRKLEKSLVDSMLCFASRAGPAIDFCCGLVAGISMDRGFG